MSEELKEVCYFSQCNCGHIFQEKYQFDKPTDKGVIGFCWCGFCRTRVDVYAKQESQ